MTNRARKVEPFNYQREGRVATPNWGEFIIQDTLFEDP